ncbi:MAG: amylo-alpha-1,6-glucosidase [Ktedonobacterales bacterium]
MIDDLPTLNLDPSTFADLDADLGREWLVTNGLGGYAMGTLCGATTRAHHGLLVAAVRPPVERIVLVAKLDEVVTLFDGRTVPLGTNEWAGGAIAPKGYQRLVGFGLDGLVPRFTYHLDGSATTTRLEKRVWMEHGFNLTFVQYAYAAPEGLAPVTLALTPFCLHRDHEDTTVGAPDWRFEVDVNAQVPNFCTVRAFPSALPCHLVAGPDVKFTPSGEWYFHIYHRTDHARGLPDTEDVYVPGAFHLTLAPNATATLVLSAGPALPSHLAGLGGAEHESVVSLALDREHARCHALLAHAGSSLSSGPLSARLVLAADQFLVARPEIRLPVPAPRESSVTSDDGAPGVTVIAGYPWFTDWGRDAMIALPGLTLVTGRYAEAGRLLRTFASYTDQGLIPNRFPDDGAPAEYNTADATLWFFHALDRYIDATGDTDLLSELFPLLVDIISWHVRGTRYGIGVDPADGLLRAGASGQQLTWMDAKADDWVVTPRRGKPVEINALWYAALTNMSSWSRRLVRDPVTYDTLRTSVAATFFTRFWYEAGGYLYDVLDVEGQTGVVDWSLRPNQLFALALAPELIPPERARTILSTVESQLIVPLGLRTLAPDDPRFLGAYVGDRRARDAAYHQGTVWPWLLGAYADACRSVYGDTQRVRTLLDPFAEHLLAAGLGTISEVVDGAPPYRPSGCIAQAWSVAEALRIVSLSL